jgi:predicted DNA-binding transcriptional regulator AlpA
VSSFALYHTEMDEHQLLHEVETHLAIATELLRQVQLRPAGDAFKRGQLPTFRMAYSILEVQKLVGLGRTTIFKAIKEGRLVALKEGDRTLALSSELSRWISTWRIQSANSSG